MPAPAATAAADVRARDHEGLLTPDGEMRLQGIACASCGDQGHLRPGGYAYRWLRGGRLGYAVRVCSRCPAAYAERQATGD